MGVYLGFLVVGLPCLLFIIYCYTPKGKEWRRSNGLLLKNSLSIIEERIKPLFFGSKKFNIRRAI